MPSGGPSVQICQIMEGISHLKHRIPDHWFPTDLWVSALCVNRKRLITSLKYERELRMTPVFLPHSLSLWSREIF